MDAVNISRVRQWQDKPKLLERFFHPDELTAALSKGVMRIPALAARFAAKEAFGKAIGTGLIGFALKELCVLNDKNGKPFFALYGRAEQALRRIGGERAFVSLTHENDYAIAVVIIEGSDERS